MFVKAVTLNDGRMSDTYDGCESGELCDFVVQGPWEEEVVRRIWSDVIADLGVRGGTLLFSQRAPDIGRATYIGASHVYKLSIHALHASRNARANDLAEEYAILRKCAGVAGTPVALDLKRTPEYDALVIEKVDGTPANDLGIAPLKKAVISIKLIPLIVKLAARHVSHNDITLENVLVKPRNRPVLIDFDQATDASFVAAVLAMFFGRPVVGQVVHNCLFDLLKESIADIRQGGMRLLPSAVQQKIRMFREKRRQRLPRVPAHSAAAGLRAAWEIAQKSNASSPGVRIAYYSYEYGRFRFPGERSWKLRWDTLRTITPLDGRRVLELGCNMALLSTNALAHENAVAALAVDSDPDILRAAALVAGAHGVHPGFARVDFDSPEDWESELRKFRPDVVFALSVFNWVRQKERFLRFLGNFDLIVFEGHDPFDVESRRLRQAGFSKIDLIGYSERSRPLMRASK